LRGPQSLRNGCAVGSDGTGIEMYKATIHITLPYIKALFIDILSSVTVPAIWCESQITPIHKKGSYSDPNNYRAVSVANSLSKVFKKILSTRLTIWANINGAIDESHAGFRGVYSTTGNMFNLNAVIQKYTSK